MGHVPVLINEVLKTLAPAKGETIVDGTFGGGGYAMRILAAADCKLIGIDRDLDAIARAEELAVDEPRLVPVMGRFGELDELLKAIGIEQVDGVVLDIGVSSFQIDQAGRGFSFMRDGPLDMRMGQSGPSAADVVNRMDETGIANVIFRLGEEKRSRAIARAIVARRLNEPFTTTLDLAAVVEDAVGGRRGAKTHPATRTFQAIRMYVNDELGELARGLAAAERMLAPGGRLAVVTFHSLEDRMVKQFFRDRSGGGGTGSRYLPAKDEVEPTFTLVNRKAIEPGEEETSVNPRARSSRLRVGRRTDVAAWEDGSISGFDLPDISLLEVSS